MLTSQDIKDLAGDAGADLCAIADTQRLESIFTYPGDLLVPYRRAISIAVRLDDPVLDAIEDLPTADYNDHYKVKNLLLDSIALGLVQAIEEHGGSALAIPASKPLTHVRYRASLSHKAVAVAAGLGWQGKSLLTITPQHGPRIRLVTVLTDLMLEPDGPLKNRCGACTKCTDACPARAIKNVSTESHYPTRNTALHFERCVERVEANKRDLKGVDSLICGVCIRVCPWGQKHAS